jgi:putative phage-type endonuclease
VPEVYRDQRTEGWLQARKGKITASIAAACLGMDPHTGPLSAFNQITGKTARSTTFHMEWGNQHEAYARAQYEIATGNLTFLAGFWLHPVLPWLGASPDSFIGEEGMVEVKCPAAPVKEIPRHHEIQMRVQMAVTGRHWCDYYAWTQADAFIQRVERDDSREVHLLNALEAFYRAYLLPSVAPPRRRPKEATSDK